MGPQGPLGGGGVPGGEEEADRFLLNGSPVGSVTIPLYGAVLSASPLVISRNSVGVPQMSVATVQFLGIFKQTVLPRRRRQRAQTACG